MGKVTFTFCKLMKMINFFRKLSSAFDPRIATYTRENIDEVVHHSSFRSTGRTVFFHFDKEDYSRQQQVTEIITSYLYTNSYNVIMVIYDDPTVINDFVRILFFIFYWESLMI